MLKKLKRQLQSEQVFIALTLVLVGVGSFGLGRLSATPESNDFIPNEPRVLIMAATSTSVQYVTPRHATTTTSVADINTVQPVVASRSGTKYHLPNCPGASQIKPENRLEFASPSAARAAGYTPAANCPGVY